MSPTGPAILAASRVLPEHRVDQAQILEVFKRLWRQSPGELAKLEDLHRAVGVAERHLALPLQAYAELGGLKDRNDAWIRIATELGEKAVAGALEKAGVGPEEVNHLFFVTVTGLSTPSIDARLSNRLGLRRDLKRTPIFGLGCVAGACALARAADYLRAYPDQVAVVLSVELCSLTLQKDDVSVANLVASGLFGDGAAAVVLAGEKRGRSPRVIANRSVFYRDTEWVMGWDIVDTGFKVVLSPKVPEVIRAHLLPDVEGFLRDEGHSLSEVRHFVAHTGGPKVLRAMEEALALGPDALFRSWRSLNEVGNLSSASVLFVLGELLDEGVGRAGDLGLLMAMGPGFCAELVLLEW